jgi:hypothetical protein
MHSKFVGIERRGGRRFRAIGAPVYAWRTASHLPFHAEADTLHANKLFVKENEPDSEFKLAEPIRTE